MAIQRFSGKTEKKEVVKPQSSDVITKTRTARNNAFLSTAILLSTGELRCILQPYASAAISS